MEFELIDEDEFNDIITEIDKTIIEEDNYKVCINCDIQMNIDINNKYTCKECGYIRHITTENDEYQSSSDNYNTNSNYNLPIKCVGPKSYNYQKCIRNSTSEYNTIQEKNIKNKLYKLNYQSTKLSIPKNIISNVIEQYKFIRNNYNVYRGDILKGILGSLIYYQCLKEKIIRKPREIAQWCNITESNLSKGDKIIRNLHEDGVLKLNLTDNLESSFINSYLIRLEIDLKYSEFLYELLIYINTYKIGNLNSRLSTKVSSIIYLLILSKDMNISIDTISEEFDISISTFKTYYNNIYKKRELLIPLFEKYEIKQPIKLPRKNKRTQNLSKDIKEKLVLEVV